MIELHMNKTHATIDTQGAWLTRLSDETGEILFPKASLPDGNGGTKTRGGCHVCLPNFGPGGNSEQLQHGFGRQVEWEIREEGGNYAVLELARGHGDYEALSSRLTFLLEDTILRMTLNVTNTSAHNELRIAPGFHPYFALDDSETTIELNGARTAISSLDNTEFSDQPQQTIRTNRREIQCTSQNLPVWAQWSDLLGNYVCVEPTLAGYAFLKDTPDTNELLAPGEAKLFSFEMTWSAAA